MNKVDIDYSNTIIYKIYCKDVLIKDIYVGHTTNFVQRKYSHKQACNNIKSPYYNLKLYKTIRENGNWSNWDMSIIQFYNCKDYLEVRKKEQVHFLELKANLNSIEPYIEEQKKPNKIIPNKEENILLNEKATKFNCLNCGHHYASKSGLWKHSNKCNNQNQNQNNNNNSQHLLDIIKKYEDIKCVLMEQNKQLLEQNKQLLEQNNNFIEILQYIKNQ